MMKRKFLGVVLISALTLSLVACGSKEATSDDNVKEPVVQQEQTVENDVVEKEETVESEATVEQEPVVEEIVEGDAPIEGDPEINDDIDWSSEIIDLTNTRVINIGESLGYTLNMPVYTFAYSETNPYGISYIAQNVDGNNFYESYVLSFSDYSNANNAEEAYAFMERELNDYSSDENFEVAEIRGDASTNYIVMYAYSAIRDNGTEKKIQDFYYVYDAAGTDIYLIKLNIAKDSAMYGVDVLEKSTATYRQEFLNAVLALVN